MRTKYFVVPAHGTYRCQSLGDFIETLERQRIYFD